jgi:hypothetical protein
MSIPRQLSFGEGNGQKKGKAQPKPRPVNGEMVCDNAINPQLWNNPLHCDETTGWTWSQDEATVKWYSDGKFATYVGTVYGDSMSGTGSNDWGNSWTWTATPAE